MRACAIAEAAGVRALAVVSSGFVRQAQSLARSLGIAGVWVSEYPGVIPVDSTEELGDKVRTVLVPSLLAGLAAERDDEPVSPPEPDPRSIAFAGTLDEVQDYFVDQSWSDGLPVIPPTIDRIQRFLEYTDRDTDEVLGVLRPGEREASVWAVAVNGVMAGCRPEYMPVLLAVTEAVADPEFAVEDAGSTPGWEPLVILSGRLAKELDFNAGAGVMRVGRRANTTVGRFLRLLLRNVADLRIPPGDTDKASVGYSFNVAMAEDEDAIDTLGWEPFRVDRGFGREQDVVTVQSVVAISPPIYSSGTTALDHLETIAYLLGATCGPWAFTGVWFGRWHPLLVLGPAVAKAFADDGWGKDDIRRYLFEHLTMPARWFDRYAADVISARTSLQDLVDQGLAPSRYAESEDPERPVPLLVREEWTGIVVAGDSGRNQSRAYINNHKQGPPVSRPVVLPRRWAELRAERMGAR
jgi:hypothetical protein